MNRADGIFFLGLLFATAANGTLAADESTAISQVSGNAPAPEAEDNAESSLLQHAHNDGSKKDYQKQILSNPEISDIGRANALTGGGGNTAVIVQQGTSNHSTVKQTGKDNYANQTQKGKANDIYLDQQGNHNRSQENQVGDYNHKIKIQNGTQEESTTTTPSSGGE